MKKRTMTRLTLYIFILFCVTASLFVSADGGASSYARNSVSGRAVFSSPSTTVTMDTDKTVKACFVFPSLVAFSSGYFIESPVTLRAALVDTAGYESLDVSFEWGTVSGSLENASEPVTCTGPCEQSLVIDNLQFNTPYYYRLKAVAGSLVTFSEERSFILKPAPPGPPVEFSGNVYINGSPAPPETVVEARVPGAALSNPAAVTVEAGLYTLSVPDAGDVTRVDFFINGVEAETALISQSSGFVRADLSVSGDAPPFPKHQFRGNILVNGQPAPPGTTVEVRGDGVFGGPNMILTDQPGSYGTSGNLLTALGRVEEGTPLNFYIDGIPTGRTYPWHAGALTEIDLASIELPVQIATLPAFKVDEKYAVVEAQLDLSWLKWLELPKLVSFQWGTSPGNLDHETAPTVEHYSPVIRHEISGLLPDTVYYYRAKAVIYGATIYGQESSFKTLLGIPELPRAFWGSLQIDGSPAPVGTVVEVRGDGVRTGILGNPVVTTEPGLYGRQGDMHLIVQGNIPGNARIDFYVNGIPTGNHLIIPPPGSLEQIDLDIASPAAVVELHEGWNTFSVPVAPGPLFDTWGEFIAANSLDVETVLAFDSQTGTWSAATDIEPVVPGAGYYIKMAASGTAYIIPAPGNEPPPVHGLFPGLNLVGPTVTDGLSGAYLDNLEISNGVRIILVHNPPINDQQGWTRNIYLRMDAAAPDFHFGQAYWVYCLPSLD